MDKQMIQNYIDQQTHNLVAHRTKMAATDFLDWSDLTKLAKLQGHLRVAQYLEAVWKGLVKQDLGTKHGYDEDEVARVAVSHAKDEALHLLISQRTTSTNPMSNALDEAELEAWRTFYAYTAAELGATQRSSK